MLEVGGQEAGKPLGRQVDLFEQERFPRGDPEALDVDDRRADLEVQRACDDLAGRLWPGRHEPCLGVEAAALHLLGEAQGVGEVAFDTRLERERAAPPGPLEASLARELAERPPDRDEAAVVADAQFALGRQPVTRRDLARIREPP